MSRTALRVTRFVVASFFWANAFFLIRFRPASYPRLAGRVNLSAPEAIIILALAVITLLRSNGLWSFSVDLAYFYFFPFVLLFYVWRLVHAALRLTRYVSGVGAIAKSGDQVAAEGAVLSVPEAQSQPAPEGPRRSASRKVLDLGLRFFLGSTLLWCLLVAFSSHKAVLEVATAVVLLHLIRALSRVGAIGWLSYKWLK